MSTTAPTNEHEQRRAREAVAPPARGKREDTTRSKPVDLAHRDLTLEVERWVAWGVGEPTPDEAFVAEVRESTKTVAAAYDPAWVSEPGGWSMVITAHAGEIERWVRDNDSAHGFVPLEQDAGDEPHPVEHPRPY